MIEVEIQRTVRFIVKLHVLHAFWLSLFMQDNPAFNREPTKIKDLRTRLHGRLVSAIIASGCGVLKKYTPYPIPYGEWLLNPEEIEDPALRIPYELTETEAEWIKSFIQNNLYYNEGMESAQEEQTRHQVFDALKNALDKIAVRPSASTQILTGDVHGFNMLYEKEDDFS